MDARIKKATEAIHQAEALLITAGAGMGVDSGLPDFRGRQGFWAAYPLLAQRGLAFEQMANPAWFRANPGLAWAFYGHRLNLYRRTKPHAGFLQLLALGVQKPQGCFVFTSNVDGHFQKAGFGHEDVLECHGSVHHWQCNGPCSDATWDASAETVAVDEGTFLAQEPLPRCRHCSRIARPNILMFGDGSWLPQRAELQRQRFTRWLNALERSSARLAVIELGAGTAVATVRQTSVAIAEQCNGTLVRINPRESEVPNGHIGLPMSALEGIQAIVERLGCS